MTLRSSPADLGSSPADLTAPIDARPGRIILFDVLRGIALLTMASYHFTWDLEFFHYIEAGTTAEGAWRLYARCIASSFLFLAGVSLVLAHGRGVRWRPFRRRFLQVAAGAGAITAVTYVVTPEAFVFFGILHEIALASVLGLPFLRLPALVSLVSGAAVIAAIWLVRTPFTNASWLGWIGLAERPPITNDYVPLFPWFGAVLIGIAFARFAADRGLMPRLAALNGRLAALRASAGLARLGRHSLAFYLIHQPVLIGLVWCLSMIAPPDAATVLANDCHRSCRMNEDEATCQRFCGCVVGRIDGAGLAKPLLDQLTSVEENDRVRGMIDACSIPEP